jgi:hypothetical protein
MNLEPDIKRILGNTSSSHNDSDSDQGLSVFNQLDMFDLDKELIELNQTHDSDHESRMSPTDEKIGSKRSRTRPTHVDYESSDGIEYTSQPYSTMRRRSTRSRTNKKIKTDADHMDFENDNNTNSSHQSNGIIKKKFSNKDAATKYRMKKLDEKDKLFDTKTILERQNEDVKKQIDHVQTEVDYLKNFLVQMLLTKGLLNNMKGFC